MDSKLAFVSLGNGISSIGRVGSKVCGRSSSMFGARTVGRQRSRGLDSRRVAVCMSGGGDKDGFKLATTNKDVLILTVVLITVPLLANEGLKQLGVPDQTAGLWVTAVVMVLLILAWTGSYLFRVGTKNMTYAQQLRDYEDGVLEARYQELSDEELAALADELEDENSAKKGKT
ncbi:hypothetical protein NDN08_001311 [Rhodosorus marinus]|uniref:Uncharacterized protein n=1 Tax=Rhodosorus marinus TaxID=101924 RepID=A0AAV8UW90_9RHOD|nr:hypothetical protein NDN08_001311 [Rhodosorus marinus]